MRAAALLLLLAGACAAAQAPLEASLAAIRLANLSPDAPQLDLLFDGELVLQDLPFPAVSGYLLIPSGRHELRVFPHRPPAEENATDSGTTVVRPLEPLVITVDVAAGSYYTLTASGFFDPPAAATGSGNLRVEMEPETTVQIRGPRNYLVSLSESNTLAGLPPGTYTVIASRPGYRSAQYEVDLQAGRTLTLPITLQAGSNGGPVAVATDDLVDVADRPWYKTQLQLYEDPVRELPPAGWASVRLVHAAPAVPGITARLSTGEDEELREQVLAEGLTFPNVSEPVLVAVGYDKLELRLSGSSLVVSELENLRFASGAVYTIFVTGSGASESLTPLPTVDALIRNTRP